MSRSGHLERPHDWWDEQAAKRPAHSDKDAFWSYYSEGFLASIRRGMRHLDRPPERFYKTDCWNEGVQVHRDVLGLLDLPPGCRTIATDVSHRACEAARERLPNLLTVQGDIRALPFADGGFDMLADLSTCDHIAQAELEPCFAEYARVLRPGGVLVLVYTHDATPFAHVKRLGFRLTGKNSWNQQYFPVDEVKRLVGARFEIRESYFIGMLGAVPFHLPGRVLSWMPGALARAITGRLLDAELSAASERWLKHLGLFHVLIARRRP